MLLQRKYSTVTKHIKKYLNAFPTLLSAVKTGICAVVLKRGGDYLRSFVSERLAYYSRV